MSDPLIDYYSDYDNCCKELVEARKKWGLTTTTLDEWRGMHRALCFILFYGPEKLLVSAESALSEFTYRAAHTGILTEL